MSYKCIDLGNGLAAKVSPEDYYIVAGYKWYFDGKYVARTIHTPFKRKVKLHRLILGLKPGEQGDHINRDRFDNTRENLRAATPSQNAMNRKTRRESGSGLKGVSWVPHMSKWRSSITREGKKQHLGCFGSKEEAARAYNEAAMQLHGEYAHLNQV